MAALATLAISQIRAGPFRQPATERLFNETKGTDPIFRTNDGSNCDHNIDTSSVDGRKHAYSLLTSRGLFRIALDVPAGAEYDVVSVNNPYGCTELSTVSTYRRALPTTNLKFLSTVMWDGRESTGPSTQKITFATNPVDLLADLAHQAVDATNGQAQGTTPLTTLQQQIVDFETHLFTAQSIAREVGALDSHGATGGPAALSKQDFFVGISDPLGGNPHGTAFTPAIFNLFEVWTKSRGHDDDDQDNKGGRASIVRGEALFNSKPINITGVAGLNDTLNTPLIPGNCGTCHSSPNAGNHSVSLPINIGVADLSSSLNLSYLPVVTLRNKVSGQMTQTTDPGRALITGK